MLLSASEPLTTLIKLPAVIVKLPAVIVLAAPHKPVAAQTDPAVKPVSHVPQNGTAAQAKPVQSAGHGVAGSAGATPTVVNIVPAPTPSSVSNTLLTVLFPPLPLSSCQRRCR